MASVPYFADGDKYWTEDISNFFVLCTSNHSIHKNDMLNALRVNSSEAMNGMDGRCKMP